MDFREEDSLEPYLDLTAEEVARLVLCLLAEEEIGRRLASYRLPDCGEWMDNGDGIAETPPSPTLAL